jgi:hypothetical protein
LLSSAKAENDNKALNTTPATNFFLADISASRLDYSFLIGG